MMIGGKEQKPFPKIKPNEPPKTDGRTVMFINDDGLVSASEMPCATGQLVLIASDADEEIEVYAPTSPAN